MYIKSEMEEGMKKLKKERRNNGQNITENEHKKLNKNISNRRREKGSKCDK
jgi:hypothetical protein